MDRGRQGQEQDRAVEPPPPPGVVPRLPPGAAGQSQPSACRDLAETLRQRLRGEVRFDDGSRALYATDGSNYRQVPIGVVVPRDADDVVQAVAVCHEFGVPLLPRGCGTSLAGQCCNVAVVLDISKHMRRIVDLDPAAQRARIEPGVVLDRLREAAEAHHLTFGPDPSTHTHCTLGGMMGNNSCGVHSVMAGRTSDNVEELEVLTYDGVRLRVGATSDEELARKQLVPGRVGQIYRDLAHLRDRYADLIRARFPQIPRRVSGYNLDELLPERGFHVARALVGTEGTCVSILEATVRLVPSPPARSLLVLGYPSVYEAADHVLEVMDAGPIGLEGIDDRLVEDMKIKGIHPKDLKLLPGGKGFLLVEFGGETREESHEHARRLMRALAGRKGAPTMKLYDDRDEERHVWLVRESGLGATALVPGRPDTWEGWEDSAVPPAQLGSYLRELRALFERFGYGCSLYGHFGQGCVHTRIDFDLRSEPGIRHFRRFLEAASELVLRHGGSLSGEHGDGQSRAELLPKMFGPELCRAFAEFKNIWDPDGRMNPRKVVDPYRIDENLRLRYRPPELHTHFRFPDDRGSFARAAERCVGIGNCRETEHGTMCPSYMVTRDEEHSTRGRAHLLFEMMHSDPLDQGWRNDAVRDALDLCLACKGCKGECPVNVDMATYKAEFLSHYYAGRLRPRSAYGMGFIHRWARLASPFAALTNVVSHAPLLAGAFKRVAGIAPERQVPAFARRTFRDWFAARPSVNLGGRPVLLWPDTFNNYFHPETAVAATEVLEQAGFRVVIPDQILCCGRPLYDFGFLDRAERLLCRTLSAMRPHLDAGLPVIGLEPSCVAVFRDELHGLFPDDPLARRLREQSQTLAEFLRAERYQPPLLDGRALLHGHCHHKAIMKLTAEEQLLQATGLDMHTLDSGCCGMAGSFGFERQHYDLSMQVGERVLLPAVRRAPPTTYVIADGFSCREQIAQGTPRRALHTAEVLHLALRQREPVSEGAPAGQAPEKRYLDRIDLGRPRYEIARYAALALGVGTLLAGGRLLLKRRRR